MQFLNKYTLHINCQSQEQRKQRERNEQTNILYMSFSLKEHISKFSRRNICSNISKFSEKFLQ